jgi:DNA-directed RNA polymerase III subunit RPC6
MKVDESMQIEQEEQVLALLCDSSDSSGLTSQEIMDKIDIKSTTLLDILNTLAKSNKIEFLTINNSIVFCPISSLESNKLSKMSQNDKIVYNFIKESHQKGTWLKNIKEKSGLHIKNCNDSIQKLEKLKIIKLVKSVKQPAKKVYMLYELEPSMELTGGSWYTDDQMDVEFIDALSQMIMRFLEKVQNSYFKLI